MIRAKLIIIFFVFIIVPMFLLWARWQTTAIGSIKSVLRQELAERAHEISDQITQSLQNHQKQIISLTEQPALKSFARAAAQRGQAAPDQNSLRELTVFLLTNQKDYSALLVINRQGAPLFKLETHSAAGGIAKVFYIEREFSNEDIVRAPEALNDKSSDAVFTSEIQQDSSGPHVKLIAPLRNTVGTVTSVIVVKLKTDRANKNSLNHLLGSLRRSRMIRKIRFFRSRCWCQIWSVSSTAKGLKKTLCAPCQILSITCKP